MSRIAVIGVGYEGIRPDSKKLLDSAGLVVGGRRHLEMFGIEAERSIILKGDLSEALSRIESSEGRVVVLASGDPGLFGIVRVLSERFDAGDLLVLPAVSSVSAAFARAGLPWDDALVVSAHGRDPRRAVNVCRSHHKVAVFTSPDFGPAELARGLGPSDRTFFVAQKLGEADERIVCASAAEIAVGEWEDPNVVLVWDAARAVARKGWISSGVQSSGGWALPESEFEYPSGMITKSETRALILARLGPGRGDLIWDIGAGSGSVAIECARLGAAATAIERDPESVARIRRNVERHGVYVEVVEGEAPAALKGLLEPDAVFIGGTGGDFAEIVKLAAVRARRCVVLALIGIERVVPAGEILEDCGLVVETTFLQTSRMKGIGNMHRLVPASGVFVVVGNRP
ncbi:MAG TPA: precorrin-6y C5,15-methyltransferase (decarboxylating) subunit CbiE [Rubrobacteraceae bacterium]|nr:precorrin-6y C5,15-methyltransferase (decarboxylating) subunit CbiE [Rubrobacteraceae bacterium]